MRIVKKHHIFLVAIVALAITSWGFNKPQVAKAQVDTTECMGMSIGINNAAACAFYGTCNSPYTAATQTPGTITAKLADKFTVRMRLKNNQNPSQPSQNMFSVFALTSAGSVVGSGQITTYQYIQEPINGVNTNLYIYGDGMRHNGGAASAYTVDDLYTALGRPANATKLEITRTGGSAGQCHTQINLVGLPQTTAPTITPIPLNTQVPAQLPPTCVAAGVRSKSDILQRIVPGSTVRLYVRVKNVPATAANQATIVFYNLDNTFSPGNPKAFVPAASQLYGPLQPGNVISGTGDPRLDGKRLTVAKYNQQANVTAGQVYDMEYTYDVPVNSLYVTDSASGQPYKNVQFNMFNVGPDNAPVGLAESTKCVGQFTITPQVPQCANFSVSSGIKTKYSPGEALKLGCSAYSATPLSPATDFRYPDHYNLFMSDNGGPLQSLSQQATLSTTSQNPVSFDVVVPANGAGRSYTFFCQPCATRDEVSGTCLNKPATINPSSPGLCQIAVPVVAAGEPTVAPLPCNGQGYNVADIDKSCSVTTEDYKLWHFSYRRQGSDPRADLNRDSSVNGKDYAVWLKECNKVQCNK